MTRALLLDLDDTIIVEEPAAVAAFVATARVAAERHPLDPAALALDARARAREVWRGAPHHAFCRRIGLSSWEGLFCRYEGEGDELRALREWAPGYRREAWQRALADQDVDDDELAGELGERFGADRRALHETVADAAPTLDALGADHALALSPTARRAGSARSSRPPGWPIASTSSSSRASWARPSPTRPSTRTPSTRWGRSRATR